MGANTDDTKTLRTKLPANPFKALNFHFGMLLGVDDFATMSGNPRGKLRLHQSWLHGTGVVWGLAVSIDQDAEEVRVAPGLAIDGLGREIPVTEDLCVNLPAWFAKHREDPGFDVVDDGGTLVFDAHVVAEASACLDRPVPAVADGCADDALHTAYSRAIETVRLKLVPNAAPDDPVPGHYPRLRLWLGLREPELDLVGDPVARDQAVLDLLADTLPDEVDAVVAGLLRDDVLALRPAFEDGSRTSYPHEEPGAVVLATLRGVRLVADGDGFQLAPPPADPADATELDLTVRKEFAPTWLVQEALLAEARGRVTGAALGPQILPESVALAGDELRFETTADLAAGSVQPEAFSVTLFDGSWTTAVIVAAAPDGADAVVVTLDDAPPAGVLLRLVARGTGPTPLLGDDGTPLAGAAGSAAAGVEGRDFTAQLEVP